MRSIALLLLVACRAGSPAMPGLDALAQAARGLDAQLRRQPDDLAARRERGWIALLQGDARRAEQEFVGTDIWTMAGRALLARERGLAQEERDGWIQLLERPRDSPWSDALTVYAAERLSALFAEVPDDRSVIADALKNARLGPEARQALAALLGTLSERAGDIDARQDAAAAAGCPREWRIAGPEGQFPRLDLRRALRFENASVVNSRGCWVPLNSPIRRSGVFEAAVTFEAAQAETAWLWVRAWGPWWLEGDDGASWDRSQPQMEWLAIEIPQGRSRLRLRFGAEGSSGFSAGLLSSRGGSLVARISAQGEASLPIRSLGRREPTALPDVRSLPAQGIIRWLSASAWRRRGDDRAREELEPLLKLAPQFVAGRFLAASLETSDPTLPPALARDRARRHLGPLETSPAAWFELARLDALDDYPDRALERLTRLLNDVPTHVGGLLLAARVYRERHWDHEADLALEAAAKASPQNCDVQASQLASARARRDLAVEDDVVGRLHACDAGSDVWASFLRDRGRLTEAAAEYQRLLALDDRVGWHMARADVLQSADDISGALEELTAVLARDRHNGDAWIRRADLLARSGNVAEARAVLNEALLVPAAPARIRQALRVLGVADVWQAYRLNSRQVIRDFERDAIAYQSPAVFVLDRTVTRVLDSGALQHLTHNIVQVLSKEGIAQFSEIQLPAGADALTLRTIKVDGSTREVEEVAGKDSLSAADVAAGDYIEMEYLLTSAPSRVDAPTEFATDRFYFRSPDAPLYRSEYLLVLPGNASTPTIDRRAGAPETQLTRRDGLQVYQWMATRMSQIEPEPGAPETSLDDVPSVRVGHGRAWEEIRDATLDPLLRVTPATHDVRRLAQQQCAGQRARNCAERLFRWVTAEIEQTTGLGTPAAATLAARSGHRATLLLSLLRAVGLDAELLLARPRSQEVVDGALPETAGFNAPIVRVVLGAEVLHLDPALRAIPFGYLRPMLRGASAIRLRANTVARVTLPTSVVSDRRTIEAQISLAADGVAEVSVTENLIGWPAIEWRVGLESLQPDRVREEFERSALGFYFPGVVLRDLQIEGADDYERPLALRYRFRAPALGHPLVGKSLRVPAELFAAMLGRRYAGLPKRKTPLQLEGVFPTDMTLDIRPPPGLRFVERPSPVKLSSSFGHYVRSVTPQRNGVLVKSTFFLAPQRVSPVDYAAFAKFSRAVDHEQQGEVVFEMR